MRRKSSWSFLFAIILFIHLLAMYAGNEFLRSLTKPLILLSLMVLFFVSVNTFPSSLKKWIVAALFFSLLGDVLLMFDSISNLYFLLGLSAFLIAHLFYILFFHRIRVQENISGKPLLMVIVVLYYMVMMSLLSPHLGDMKLPVYVYAIVISFMLMLALHAMYIRNKGAAVYLVTGAILFVLSDSLLAFNKFYAPFPYAPIAIMLTYGLAQYFIVNGAIHCILQQRSIDHAGV